MPLVALRCRCAGRPRPGRRRSRRPSAPSSPSTYRPTPPRSAGTLVASTSTRGGRPEATELSPQELALLDVRPQRSRPNWSDNGSLRRSHARRAPTPPAIVWFAPSSSRRHYRGSDMEPGMPATVVDAFGSVLTAARRPSRCSPSTTTRPASAPSSPARPWATGWPRPPTCWSTGSAWARATSRRVACRRTGRPRPSCSAAGRPGWSSTSTATRPAGRGRVRRRPTAPPAPTVADDAYALALAPLARAAPARPAARHRRLRGGGTRVRRPLHPVADGPRRAGARPTGPATVTWSAAARALGMPPAAGS